MDQQPNQARDTDITQSRATHEQSYEHGQTQENDQFQSEVSRIIFLFSTTLKWLDSLSSLALLEFKKSFIAVRWIIAINFFLLPAILFLYFSICFFCFALAYELSGSLLVSTGIAITFQILTLLITQVISALLKRRIGFDETTKELIKMKKTFSDNTKG